MKKFKINFNLILSFGSLMVTVFLLFLAIFGWYVTNSQCQVNGINAGTGIKTNEFKLYYWETSNERWVETNAGISIEDAWPNDVAYFKLVATGLEVDQTLCAKLDGISTSLNTEIVTGNKVGSTYNVCYDGTVMYSSSNTQIKDSENKVIYSLTSSKTGYEVQLDDYKIEDVYSLYTNPTIDKDGKPTYEGTTAASTLTSTIFDVTAASTSLTKYFALKFVSAGDKDNYYQYQGINIQSVTITL